MKRLIILLTITFTSCQFYAEIKNEESEKKKAEVVANQFFENYNQNDFQKNIELIASATIEENGKDELEKIQEELFIKRGKINNRQIHKWSTIRSADKSWEVSLIFLIDYENSKGVQQMDFIKEDGEIKLLFYNAN